MKVKTWQIITVVICLILGTLLHFTYDWSGENIIVGLFSAVNESTWEHLKLIFFPMFLMSIIGYFFIGNKSYNYWLAQVFGIIIAMTFITVFFYTYTGAFGINSAILNIAAFVVAVLIAQFIIYKMLKAIKIYNAESISIFLLIILLFSFILYTFEPPQIPLFQDPITGGFGINLHIF